MRCGATALGLAAVNRALGIAIDGVRPPKDERDIETIAAELRHAMGLPLDAPVWACAPGCRHQK